VAVFITTIYLSSQLFLGIALLANKTGSVNKAILPAAGQMQHQVHTKHSTRVNTSASFPPLKILRQYRLDHGADVLRNEFDHTPATFQTRKFLVVYYSCPHEAGNLLHDFYNQALTAVILNRTILLKYNDAQTCSDSRLTGKNQTRCFKANTQAECEQALQRAEWLPMYDEWIEHISFSSALPLRDSKVYTLQDWRLRKLVSMRPSQFYIPGAMGSIWRDEIFQSQHVPHTQVKLRQLYSRGADLLYGMMFHELLSFNPQIAPPEIAFDDRNAKTFVLHSRHAKNSDAGDHIQAEVQCLTQLLPKRILRSTSLSRSSCIVYLMSDRETTIEMLTQYIRKNYPHCLPVVATHGSTALGSSPVNAGHYQEHGKWAGVGFLQDLMVGSRAVDGFVGHCHRSSSQLLREQVEYNRQFENHEYNGAMPPLPTCCLP
jgi:hypothetical protein